DVLVAAVAAVLDLLLWRRSRLGWVPYGLAVVYIAINVPVTRVLGSPLSLSMLRAARGPLADSIAQYMTAGNIGNVLLVGFVGLALPTVQRAIGRTAGLVSRTAHDGSGRSGLRTYGVTLGAA